MKNGDRELDELIDEITTDAKGRPSSFGPSGKPSRTTLRCRAKPASSASWFRY